MKKILLMILTIISICSACHAGTPKISKVDFWNISFGNVVKDDGHFRYYEISIPLSVTLEDFNNTVADGIWTFHVRSSDFKKHEISLPQDCELTPVKFTDKSGKVISTRNSIQNSNKYYRDAAFAIGFELNKTSILIYDKSHFYRDYLVTGDINIWESRFKYDALYCNLIYSRLLNVIVLGRYDYRVDYYLMKNANGVWKKLEPLFLKDAYDISDATQEEADFAEKYIKILGITGTGLKGA